MPSGFPSKFTILLLLCTLLTITVGAMQGQDEAGPYVNSVGVHLPPDAAPPDAQVLTTFELNNRFMDHAFTSYQKVFGFALINEPLVRVDRNFNLIPAAATHWEVTADGRTWIFHIRPNLIYNDGRPLNAHNYVAMFRRWADPETAFDFEWYYRPIRNWSASIASRVPPDSIGVQASDDLTLMVTTERPAPYMPGLLSYTWVASDHAIEKHGQAWSTSVETSVSSGPFQLREWLQGDRIVLEPNPHYRGPAKPYLERVVAKLYSAVAPPPFLPAYEAGETDYILLTNQAEINRIKTDPTLQAQLNTYADFATLYLTMNTYHPPFNDIRVRQAFSHAIDQEALIKSAMRSIGLSASSMLQPGFPGGNPAAFSSIQGYDPDLARQRLAEAGFPDGKGFPRVDIWVQNTQTHPVKMGAQAVQAMLKQNLNIDIGVNNIERKVFMEALNTHNLPLALVGYRYDYVDASNLLTLWLSNGRHAWRNERFEALVLEANELVGDSERRMALYQEAEKILVSDVGAVFLWYPLLNEMWKPHVRGEALEPNRWGYRAWRGDQMQDVTPTLYITNEVMKGRASTAIRQSSDFWQWLMK
jgi:oligopeptide transport system substrate-binding protein